MHVIGRGRYAREVYPIPRFGPIIQSVPYDFGTIAPGTAAFFVPLPGARLGDALLVNPTTTLSNSIFLVHYHVQSSDLVDLELYNIDGAPIVVGVFSFLYTLFRG